MAQVNASGPTSVYRYYDAMDALIYVGITSRGMTRNREHNSRAVWWKFVARQEVDHYPTRVAAEAAEKKLIRFHLPPFNKTHNPHHQELRKEYLSWSTFAGAALDPVATFRSIGSNMALEAIDLCRPDRFMLRTLPEHHAVARHLAGLGGMQVMAPKYLGRIEQFELVGRAMHMVVRVRGGRVVPRLESAVALGSLRMDTSANGPNRPPLFRLKHIELFQLASAAPSPDPGPPAERTKAQSPSPAELYASVPRHGWQQAALFEMTSGGVA
jgi:hypothetical protein